MPTVTYTQSDLVTETYTEEVTDPETGEIQEIEREQTKFPFEVRIAKWLERADGYHLHGFVGVTEFGQSLATATDPWMWLQENYTVADGVTEADVSEMVDGVGLVTDARLDGILEFGNVAAESATVTSQSDYRFDIEVILDGAETFDIDWLEVDFDPARGGE